MNAAMEPHFGEFELRRLIGRGGMGEVYEAYQASLDRPVALKILPPWLLDDPDYLERFRREAAVTARLDHPNILPVFSSGCEQSRYYFAMKLVRGMSLSELLRRHARLQQIKTAVQANDETQGTLVSGLHEQLRARNTLSTRMLHPIPPSLSDADIVAMSQVCDFFCEDRIQFAAHVGAKVARALAYAHTQQQLHRDVKPSNIMVDKHNHVYLIDFGLTRTIDVDFTHHRCGTPRFMSPEQLKLDDLDGRTDIYSLGVSLFELISGKHPFGTEGESDLRKRILRGDRPRITELVPDIPERLAHAIDRAMDPDVNRRFADAGEFADELSLFNQTMTLTAKSTEQSSRPISSVLSRRSGAPLIFATLTVTAIVATAITLARPFDTGRTVAETTTSTQAATQVLNSANTLEELAEAADSALLGTWRKVDLRRHRLVATQDNTGISWWNYLPERNELRVNALGFVMISLGDTRASHYRFRVGMQQNEWRDAGIFVGDHEVEFPNGGRGRKFHCIELNRAQDGSFWMKRAVGVIQYQNERPPLVSQWDLATTPITPPVRNQEHTFEISVGPDGIEDVIWQGHHLDDHTSPRLNEQLAGTDFFGTDYGFVGNYGVVVRGGGNAAFRNAQIMVTSPENRL